MRIIFLMMCFMSLLVADEQLTFVREERAQVLEYTVAPYASLNSGPAHSVVTYSDGLWIVVKPLEDSTVRNFFGAYPSLSLQAQKLHELFEKPEKISEKTVPRRQGAENSARYIFGQSRQHSFQKCQGLSYMAQYTQGPGDHSLNNEDLYWCFQGLVYSEFDRRAFVVQAGMSIAHKGLETARPRVDVTDESSKIESKALDALASDGFEPTVESAILRISEIVSLVEQGVPAKSDRAGG